MLHPGQRDLRLMSLGVVDRKLSAFANGEVVYSVDRLFGMIQDVSDRPALAVSKIIVAGCVHFGHGVLQSGWSWRIESGRKTAQRERCGTWVRPSGRNHDRAQLRSSRASPLVHVPQPKGSTAGEKTRAIGLFRAVTSKFYACPDGLPCPEWQRGFLGQSA